MINNKRLKKRDKKKCEGEEKGKRDMKLMRCVRTYEKHNLTTSDELYY